MTMSSNTIHILIVLSFWAYPQHNNSNTNMTRTSAHRPFIASCKRLMISFFVFIIRSNSNLHDSFFLFALFFHFQSVLCWSQTWIKLNRSMFGEWHLEWHLISTSQRIHRYICWRYNFSSFQLIYFNIIWLSHIIFFLYFPKDILALFTTRMNG